MRHLAGRGANVARSFHESNMSGRKCRLVPAMPAFCDGNIRSSSVWSQKQDQTPPLQQPKILLIAVLVNKLPNGWLAIILHVFGNEVWVGFVLVLLLGHFFYRTSRNEKIQRRKERITQKGMQNASNMGEWGWVRFTELLKSNRRPIAI